jgi:CubicO group peptidase (beta-lactamase class C family)
MDSLYWIASMTKLVTVVATVQLIERGILSLDEDVRDMIPELRDIKMLQEMRRGAYHAACYRRFLTYVDSRGSFQPEFQPVDGKLTLRYVNNLTVIAL